MITFDRYRSRRKYKPETLIQNAIREYLAFNGWFVMRHQQGLGSMPGLVDLTAAKGGVTIYIEVKAPKGKLSPAQEIFKRNIRSAGCKYILARNIEDVINAGI